MQIESNILDNTAIVLCFSYCAGWLNAFQTVLSLDTKVVTVCQNLAKCVSRFCFANPM